MSEPRRFQTGSVLAISFAHLLHDVYSSFLAPILPLLIAKLRFGYGLAGALSLAQRLPSLLNPLMGIIADRTSLRLFLVVSPSLTAVSMSLLGAAPHYTVLVLLCLVMGVSATLFHVPAPVMIKEVSGDRVGKGMSFYMLGGELARTLGPLTILGAVSLWGLEGTYRLIPFGLLTSLVLHLRVRRIRLRGNDGRSVRTGMPRSQKRAWTVLFLTIGGFMTSRALMKAALTTFLPTYLTAQGASLWTGGVSLALLQLSGALGTLFCGSLSDRWGRRLTLVRIAAVSPFLMVLFMLVRGAAGLPVLFLLGFFVFAPNPVMLALVQDLNSHRPAFLNGIYMTINFSIGALANVGVGVLGDAIGLQPTYWIAAGLAFAAIPLAVSLKG